MPETLIVGSVITLFSIGVIAQEHDDHDDEEESEFAIGLLVGNEQSLYLGGKSQTQVFPFLRGQWGRFFLEGPTVGAALYQDDHWSIKTAIAFDGIGDNNRDDSHDLSDMGDFDSVFMGQFAVGYEANWGELELALASDLSGTHDGYTAEISYGYPMQLGRWMIEPSIQVDWFSEEVSQYYYGVTHNQTRINRAFYQPNAGFNYGLGLRIMYPFMQRHALMFNAEYTRYSSEITDSPIVVRDNTAEMGVGYIYRF